MELHTLSKEKGGADCNRSRLVNSLEEIMEDETKMLLSPGVATMLISKSKAATVAFGRCGSRRRFWICK